MLSCREIPYELDLSMYSYRDTRNLVNFEYNAKVLFESKGDNAFEYFKANRHKFRTSDYYIYIYDMEGNCHFNVGVMDLEGRNALGYTDRRGKKIFRMILNVLEDQNNPHSWVHFSWFELGKIYPVSKSTCNFKVTGPGEREYIIGGGMNYPPEER